MYVKVKKPSLGYNPNLQDNNKAFYNSSRWRGKNGLRNQRLATEPYCRLCGKPGEMVDHIDPINNGGDADDLDNTQTLCHICHNKKRQTERKLYKETQ